MQFSQVKMICLPSVSIPDQLHKMMLCGRMTTLRVVIQYFYTDRSKAVLLLWFLTVLAVCVYTLVHLLC